MNMTYFDDIRFVDGAVTPQCRAIMNRRFPATYSIEFLLDGSMFSIIDRGPRVILDRPTLFWHHPRHHYRYGAVDSRGWDHHWVLIAGPRAKRIVETGLMSLSPAGYLLVPEPRVCAALFHELVAIIHDQSPHRHPSAVLCLERLLALVSDWIRRADDHPVVFYEGVGILAEAIERDPCRRFNWPAEARRLHLSYGHFRRLMRIRLGRPPHEHLLMCRMRHAVRLLQDHRRPVKAVAGDLGYDDVAQFSKLFKKIIGFSPNAYRQALP